MAVPELVVVAEAPGLRISAAAGCPSFLAASLDLTPVDELLSLLVRQRKTGRLDVIAKDGTRSLFFDGGSYTGCTSTYTSDRLGEVLWRAGRITLENLLIAGEQVKTGKLLGRVLIDLGFMASKQLRSCLVEQAVAVFRAACLQEHGVATFIAEVVHRSPLRFGISTQQMVDDAVTQARNHRHTVRKIGGLDRLFVAVKTAGPLPAAAATAVDQSPAIKFINEGEQALWQLALSSPSARSAIDLIEGSGLGPYAGARALLELMTQGHVQSVTGASFQERRLRPLCQAITVAMAALDEAGFGSGDQVRELLQNPPAALDEAFSILSLHEGLEEGVVLRGAQFIAGGVVQMNAALQAILDEALRQVDDTLPADLTTAVSERVRLLLAAGSQ